MPQSFEQDILQKHSNSLFMQAHVAAEKSVKIHKLDKDLAKIIMRIKDLILDHQAGKGTF